MNKLNKPNSNRLIDRERDDSSGRGVRGQGVKQKGQRAHRHGQQSGGCGEWGEEDRIRGINGNVKNVIKIKIIKTFKRKNK